MGSRRHINRKDNNSSKLPKTNDILRTRPFSPRPSRSTKPKETVDFKIQLERGASFGYNGEKIPVFAPLPTPSTETTPENSGVEAPSTETNPETPAAEAPLTETNPENSGVEALSTETNPENSGVEAPSTETTPETPTAEAPLTETNPENSGAEASSTETNSETQPETEAYFGDNAWNLPVFPPAPQIQPQSESGELTDTTAIAGELDTEESEDGHEDEKSQTETEPIAKGKNIGYNAWNLRVFPPAPEIQPQSESGELTDTTALSGELDTEESEDGHEDEKSPTENQPIAKGKNIGYNAWNLPVFAPPIQPKLGIGEVANSDFQQGNAETPLANGEPELLQPQEHVWSISLRLTDKERSLAIKWLIQILSVDSNTANAILTVILEGANDEPWLKQRQIFNGEDSREYVKVIINIQLLKQYYSESAKARPLSPGTELQVTGIVSTQEGVNLRDKPLTGEGSAVLKNLPFNTRVFVDQALPGDWYSVTLTTGEYGYLAASNIKTNLPEPNAKLHKIASGETALVIAQKYYGNAVQPGQDLRFYVNVLVYVNPGGGIYKPNPEASWENTLTKEGYLIWIPSVEFANLLKGQVQSGSITYSAWNQVKEITTLAGNFALGGGAFVAGLLNGALESLWDTLVGFKDLAVLAWDIVESLFKGTILADAQQLWDSLSQLNLEQLIEAGIEHLAEKWNQPDFIKQWHFRGWLCGYAIAELVMLVFSEGILTAIKGAAKAGKLSEIIAKFPKVVELGQKAKTLGGDKVERLRIALKSSQPLLVARQWAANVLRIPAEILQNLSVEAIEMLKQLPRWARDRFSELNHGAMRRVLGCASPCLVNLQEVERYLKNLAADAVAGAKRLTTADEVINALPTELLNLTKLREKLAKPELMNIIMRAELTDLDFAKMRDFITRSSVGKTDSYNIFTQYLSAVVPSKIGPDLNKFIELAKDMDDSTGRALRGAMFENFAKLHVPEFQGLERATFKVPGYKKTIVNVDLFDPANGKIWEFKYQKNPLASQELDKYVPIIGQITIDELYEAKTANFVFPTRDLAELNYGKLKARPAHSVFYLEQLPNQVTRTVELQ